MEAVKAATAGPKCRRIERALEALNLGQQKAAKPVGSRRPAPGGRRAQDRRRRRRPAARFARRARTKSEKSCAEVVDEGKPSKPGP